MNRNEFISSLSRMLGSIPLEDKNEIIYDYEEHFRIGLEQGKTENEISASLGDPKLIAKQFRADYLVRQAETKTSMSNISRAIVAVLALGFLNILIVIPLYLGLAATILGLFAAAVGVVVGGIAGFLASIHVPVFESYVSMPELNPGVTIFFSIGLILLGCLFFIGVCYLAKGFYHATIRYLKMNLRIIRK